MSSECLWCLRESHLQGASGLQDEGLGHTQELAATRGDRIQRALAVRNGVPGCMESCAAECLLWEELRTRSNSSPGNPKSKGRLTCWKTQTGSLPIRSIESKGLGNARENMRYRQPHVNPSLSKEGGKNGNFLWCDKGGMGVTMSCGEARRGTWSSVWGQESRESPGEMPLLLGHDNTRN